MPESTAFAEELRDVGGDVVQALAKLRLPVVVIDHDGIIRALNDSAREWIGDVRGRRFTSFVAPESRRRVEDAFARKLIGQTDATEYEAVLQLGEGKTVVADISSVALEHDGHVVGVFGVVEPRWTRPAPSPIRDLTPRQLEVLAELELGRSTEQIARELGISRQTVRNHIRDLLKRLGARSRLEAIARARRRRDEDTPNESGD
jgi:PAS domain S-box-containing protein